MSRDLEEFKVELERLQGCCLAHSELKAPPILLYAWEPSERGGEAGYAVFLSNESEGEERYGVLRESQDYTGHG